MDHNHILSTVTSKRRWLFLLACLLPVVGLVAVLVLRIPVGSVALLALLLVCPLSHFLLMRRGGHDHACALEDSTTGAGEPAH